MLAQDVQELNQFALDLFDGELAGIPLFVTDIDDGEPDESAVWCRFAVNPDQSTLTTVSDGNRYLQEGSAVLQIMQPSNAELLESDLNAWEIADIAAQAFRSFRGSDSRLHIQNVVPQRVPTSGYLSVNLVVLFTSQHV